MTLNYDSNLLELHSKTYYCCIYIIHLIQFKKDKKKYKFSLIHGKHNFINIFFE